MITSDLVCEKKNRWKQASWINNPKSNTPRDHDVTTSLTQHYSSILQDFETFKLHNFPICSHELKANKIIGPVHEWLWFLQKKIY